MAVQELVGSQWEQTLKLVHVEQLGLWPGQDLGGSVPLCGSQWPVKAQGGGALSGHGALHLGAVLWDPLNSRCTDPLDPAWSYGNALPRRRSAPSWARCGDQHAQAGSALQRCPLRTCHLPRAWGPFTQTPRPWWGRSMWESRWVTTGPHGTQVLCPAVAGVSSTPWPGPAAQPHPTAGAQECVVPSSIRKEVKAGRGEGGGCPSCARERETLVTAPCPVSRSGSPLLPVAAGFLPCLGHLPPHSTPQCASGWSV